MSGLGAFLGGMMIAAGDGKSDPPALSFVTPDYVRLMARYNAWQNSEIGKCYIETRPSDEQAWFAPRGAFWGSAFATLNHILWGDWVWMNRFEGKPAPDTPLSGSGAVFDENEPGAYWEARQGVDRRILNWAAEVKPRDLEGMHNWYSQAEGREVSVPLGVCVLHMFNHQAHHRGQVHTLLTQAGLRGWTSDLVFMPEDVGWTG